MKELIARAGGIAGCHVLPPAGMPVFAGYNLPDDVLAFYSACGGLEFYSDLAYGMDIVSPSNFTRANPVIRGCQGEGDISYDWFIVAKKGEQYITIDLGRERFGRCYDSFWDRHALRGSSPIIALSFRELIERLINSKGEHWYWLRSDFRPYGDAYQRP
jgi:hypothetical protein